MRRGPAVVAVVSVLVSTSVVAVTSEQRMDLLVGDLLLLQHGQWWRAFTPVLVQPSGVFALVFLLLGAVALLPPLVDRFDAGMAAAAALVAGLGCLALNEWREPTIANGGSSDLVAALVGLWTVALASRAARPREEAVGLSDPGPMPPCVRGWPLLATAYSVFFAVYLVTLPTGVGRWAPVIADVAVAAAVTLTLRWTSGPRWVALVIAVCALVMAARLDDHGLGMLVGAFAGVLSIEWRRLSPHARAWGRPALGLVAVAGIWLMWTELYGVTLQVRDGAGVRQVGLFQCLVVATLALAVTSWATHLSAHSRRLRRVPLRAACAAIALVSCLAPLALAADAATATALIMLHLAVGGAALWMLSITTRRARRPSTSRVATAAGIR